MDLVVPYACIDVHSREDSFQSGNFIAAMQIQIQEGKESQKRAMKRRIKTERWQADEKDRRKCPKSLEWVQRKACEGAWIVKCVMNSMKSEPKTSNILFQTEARHELVASFTRLGCGGNSASKKS